MPLMNTPPVNPPPLPSMPSPSPRPCPTLPPLPGAIAQLPPTPAVRPEVCNWFSGYCVLMAFASCLIIGLGLAMLMFAPSANFAETMQVCIDAVTYIVTGLILIAVFLAAPFFPPSPWAWAIHLILIIIGMAFCCCLPVSVPLLLYWIKPTTRIYYRMPPH